MTAYEMLLSESQERMLAVLKPRREAEAEAIFRKWELDFAVIGKTTDTHRFVVRHEGEVKVDIPIKRLSDEAPLYERPHVPTPKPQKLDPATLDAPCRPSRGAEKAGRHARHGLTPLGLGAI